MLRIRKHNRPIIGTLGLHPTGASSAFITICVTKITLSEELPCLLVAGRTQLGAKVLDLTTE